MSVISKGKELWSKTGLGGVVTLGTAMNAGFGAMTYGESRSEGHGVGYSAARGAAEFVGWEVSPMLMTALMVPDLINAGSSVVDMAKSSIDNVNRQYKANFGGSYIDSGGAANMRQAGFYSTQQSKTNIQSRLGREARTYFRLNNY